MKDQFFSLFRTLNDLSVVDADCHLVVKNQDDPPKSILIVTSKDQVARHSEFLRLLFTNPTRQTLPSDPDIQCPRYHITLPDSSLDLRTFRRVIDLLICFSFLPTLPDLESLSSFTDLHDLFDENFIHLCFWLQVDETLLNFLFHCFFQQLFLPSSTLLTSQRTTQLVGHALDFANCCPNNLLLRRIYDGYVMPTFEEYPLPSLPLPYLEPPQFLGTSHTVPVFRSSPQKLQLHLFVPKTNDNHLSRDPIQLTCSPASWLRVNARGSDTFSQSSLMLEFSFFHEDQKYHQRSVFLDLTPTFRIFALKECSSFNKQFLKPKGVQFPAFVLVSDSSILMLKSRKLTLNLPKEWFPLRLCLDLEWEIRDPSPFFDTLELIAAHVETFHSDPK